MSNTDNTDNTDRKAAAAPQNQSAVKTPGLTQLYIMAFLMASGFTVQGFAAVFHLSDILGAGAGAVGRATGIQGLAYLAGCFLFPLVRRRGGVSRDFRILIFAAPLLAGLTLLFYFIPSLGWATAVLAGTGLATAFIWPPLMGVVSSLAEGSDLNRVMARYNLSWTLGPVLMPMIAGALYMRGSFFAFSASALIFVGGGGVYLFFYLFRRRLFTAAAQHGKPGRHNGRDEQKSEQQEQTDKPEFREHRIIGLIMLFVDSVVMGLLIYILPLSLRSDTGLNEFSVGAVVFGRSAVMTAGMWVFGHLDFWHFNRKTPLLMAGFYLLLLGGMFLFQGVVPLYVAFIVSTGIPAAYYYSSGVFHGVAGSADRSHRMAISESVITSGLFVGAAFGGTLYQLRGMRFALGSAGTVLLMGTLVVFGIVMRNRYFRVRGAEK